MSWLALQVRSGNSSVKIFAANDFLDGFRHEITNRLPAGNSFPDRGRRNVDLPTDRPVPVFNIFPCAIEHDELHQLLQIFKAIPGIQLRDIILPDEKEELCSWMGGAERFHCLDR